MKLTIMNIKLLQNNEDGIIDYIFSKVPNKKVFVKLDLAITSVIH